MPEEAKNMQKILKTLNKKQTNKQKNGEKINTCYK